MSSIDTDTLVVLPTKRELVKMPYLTRQLHCNGENTITRQLSHNVGGVKGRKSMNRNEVVHRANSIIIIIILYIIILLLLLYYILLYYYYIIIIIILLYIIIYYYYYNYIIIIITSHLGGW